MLHKVVTRPCTITFLILRSHPYLLLCLPFCISFTNIAFTLPYLLFPAFPSVMPICSVLLISKIPGLLSELLGFKVPEDETLTQVLMRFPTQKLNRSYSVRYYHMAARVLGSGSTSKQINDKWKFQVMERARRL